MAEPLQDIGKRKDNKEFIKYGSTQFWVLYYNS
jgi:hypothetical protein